MENEQFRSLVAPLKNKSRLIINGYLYIYFPSDRPNWFWRLMHRLCFGFKWEKVKE